MHGRITELEATKPVKIDEKDKKILTLLTENSRIALTKLTKTVKLSRDAVDYRIKRLIDKGVIVRFFPLIDFKKLGYTLYHVLLLVDEAKPEKQKRLLKYLETHPNVYNVIIYSDTWDLEIVFAAKTLEDFDEIMTDFSTKYSDLILEKNILETVRNYSTVFLPKEITKKQTELFKKKKELKITLDKKDLTILKLLSKDARMSSYEIAKKVKLSADAVGYRIKRLQDAEIIIKFTSLVDFSYLNYHWYTFAFTMKLFDKRHEAKLKQFVQTHPNIIKAIKTIGEYDLLFYIVADAPRKFHSTVKQIKSEFSDSVKNYQTWIAYREHVFNPFPTVLEK
jgi:DNA-binding Lrp family transcriptional regulator